MTRDPGRAARAVAVLGTGSDVGKSLITAALCRLLHRAGVRVAPFKAQNMSLNSFVTPDGREIGRAQALQAQACGLAPHVDMNPVLLKPESECRCQVVVQGTVLESRDAAAYMARTGELFGFVRESYARLAAQADVVMIEGAGSAAEVNLRDRDIANWAVADMADAAVLLVANIDTGGVFAQVVGTMALLTADERRRVAGIVINKLRGDAALFKSGVAFLESQTGVPVLGVIPFLRDLVLDQEDSVELERRRAVAFRADRVNVAVILLPRMSNFTDFNALSAEADVALRYAALPDDLTGADVVILPGSKQTIADLAYLRNQGYAEVLARHVAQGGHVVGLCGGYQMLGECIEDPHGVEGGGQVHGLGMLPVRTVLTRTKTTIAVHAIPLWPGMSDATVSGYYIHMGQTELGSGRACFHVAHRCGAERARETPQPGPAPAEYDGAVGESGRVWGTYMHGVFDAPRFRRAWLNGLRGRKGLVPVDLARSEAVTARLGAELDRWADHVRTHLDVARFAGIVGTSV